MMLGALKELLFPIHCFGCNAIGLSICSKCRRSWNSHFYIQNIEALTVYSSIRYSPIARAILLSAKENSIELADDLIISALHNCLQRIPVHLLRNAILMPIPGSARAIRKRGRDFIFEITAELSLRTGLPIRTGIKIKRSLLDQSGLSAVDRKRNVHNAFEFSGENFNGEVFLVDDLVTTGATLLEAKRALNSAGFTRVRAITACMAQTLNIGG